MAGSHMTPTHQRMYNLLSDGLAHTKQELQACLWDELSEDRVVSRHMSTLRRVLRQRSEDVLIFRPCKWVVTYQLVRLMAAD